MNVVLRNNDASGSLVIQNIGIGTGHNATLTVAQATFGPGETKNVTLTGTASCTSGSIFDYPVGINYTTANGIQAVQYGGKNLLGKCS
jgi:hypothetical protein